jgi:NhaP-type Na+/H+ or K+/H+ antiporter
LVTVGVLITWVLITVAARFLLDLDLPLSVLLGALLVVTGPTVVIPLLRHVRPRGQVASLVKWEGILNDPIGAALAVLVFEAIVAGGWREGSAVALTGLAETLIGGVVLGLVGALVMLVLMRFYHIPDYLESSFTLMMVFVVYTASDMIQEESGLLSVTVMGIAMANQRKVAVQHIVEFKENLRVLLISSLFIFLAARLDPGSLRLLGWGSPIFLLFLIAVVRPLAVFGSTPGSGLRWQEKVFLSWMAPRGIVAAAVASVFAIRLEEAGYEQGRMLVPLVFMIIVGTVAFYGLTAAPVSRRLGISGGAPAGCLLVGAHSWARDITEALQKAGIPVLVADNNRGNIAAARLAGLPTYYGNILAESVPEQLPLEGIGKLIALTANDEVNSLAALHFAEVLGRREVYQLPGLETGGGASDPESLSRDIRGRLLFEPGATYSELSRRFRRGRIVKATSLSQEFDFEAFRARYGPDLLVLFVIEGEILKVAVADESLEPRRGQTVLALVEPVENET